MRRRVIGPLTGGGRHPFSGVGGGTGRGVDLGVVVELDDLGRLEVRSGELGHADHKYRTDREVRRNQGVRRRERGLKRLEILVAEPVVPTTAWMPLAAAKCSVSRAASSTVKSTTNVGSLPGQLLEGVVEVDTGHQFGARIGVDGATTSSPIFPAAPTTPTRIMSAG